MQPHPIDPAHVNADEQLETPQLAKVATGLSVGAGLLTALSGVQLIITFDWYEPAWVEYVPYLQLLLGIAGAAMGFRVGQGATIDRNLDLAIVANITQLLLMGAWIPGSLVLGIFSLMPPMAVLILMLAVPFSIAARPAAGVVAQARRRLLEGL